MADIRDFSVVLFLVLVTICAYLATTRAISGAALALCIVASAFSVALIRNIDHLEELVFRRGEDEVLVKIREVQKDVYAKVEELRQIAAGMANFTASSIVNENRFVGRDHQERMLDRRDELEAFLKQTGVTENTRREIALRITRMVDWDLRTAIVIDAKVARKASDLPIEQLERELQQLLQQPDRVAGLRAVESYLGKRKISSEALTQALDRYRRMLESGRIPTQAPQDDMRVAPLH